MKIEIFNSWSKTWVKVMKRWMILCFWDGCTRTNEIILLYEKSVDIGELLKSCGDWYTMIIMIIFMANIKWVFEYLMKYKTCILKYWFWLFKRFIGGNDHEEIMDLICTMNCGWRLVLNMLWIIMKNWILFYKNWR